MFVSGARENPKYPRQRRRARMTFKKPVDIGNQPRAAGPTRARSKCSRANWSSSFEIEGQGQFQAHAHQSGSADQDGPEGRDGLVQEREPFSRLRSRVPGTPGWLPSPRETARPSGPDGPGPAAAGSPRPRQNAFASTSLRAAIDARIGGQVRPPWSKSSAFETGWRAGRSVSPVL